MPTPCQKGRCPARADVYDWNTTEYRKGCRRTQCQTAHRLAEQRRKDRKAAATPPATAPVAATADETPLPSLDFDLVGIVAAELEDLDAKHPLKKSLGGVAVALAHEIQFLTRLPSRSAAGAAKQLIETLERLMPAKSSLGEEAEAFLAGLAEDDDDEVPVQ